MHGLFIPQSRWNMHYVFDFFLPRWMVQSQALVGYYVHDELLVLLKSLAESNTTVHF
jgi:hypothetical protein